MPIPSLPSSQHHLHQLFDTVWGYFRSEKFYKGRRYPTAVHTGSRGVLVACVSLLDAGPKLAMRFGVPSIVFGREL